MRPTHKIFGKKLQQARIAAYLTQEDLAKLVGVRSDRIGRIEQRDIDGIDPSRIPKFADALRLSVPEFLAKVAAPSDAKINGIPRTAPRRTLSLSAATFQLVVPLASAARESVADYVDRVLRAHVEQQRRGGADKRPGGGGRRKPK